MGWSRLRVQGCGRSRGAWSGSLALGFATLAVSWGVGGCQEGPTLELFPVADGPVAGSSSADCDGGGSCPSDRPFCTNGACVECRLDDDCPGATPVCALGACVTCTADRGCPEGQACNVVLTSCAATCAGPSDCMGALGQCEFNEGYCVECLEDAQCPMGNRPACDTASGACVRCTEDSDCPMPMRRCSAATQECVECLGDADCPEPNRPACVLERHACDQCTNDAHCPSGMLCDFERARCM